MSAATTLTPAAGGQFTAGAPGIPFGRLLRVELRKLFDTRAARVLVILMVIGVLAVNIISVIVGRGEPQSLDAFIQGSFIPLGFLLPIIAIMSVTGEWSQRSALTTFMWEPRRARVLAAKFVAALIVALLGFVAVAASSALSLGIAGLTGSELDWNINEAIVAGSLIMLVTYVAQGIAFGAAVHNTAGALILFAMLPTAVSLLTALVPFLRDIREWIDINVASSPISVGEFGGSNVAHFLVSALLWIGLPAAIGVWRTLNREVK
jgi:ABC-type transport system involved in multi-copper enzyme maturation permease subunit